MSLQFGDFELDRERRQLLCSGQPVPLEPKAYELLSLLVERRPKALSRAQIRDVVWSGVFISESTLGVAVNAIRQALDDDARQPRFIRTVHGFGYAFCGEVTDDEAVGHEQGARPVESRGPYPGLSSFMEEDAEVFYGREAEVEALWERIHRRRLLAVIGPSGAGKTSFVRAGVIPARPEGWGAIVSTPGRAPMTGLAQALVPEVAGDEQAVKELLRFEDPEAAVAVLRRWRQGHAEALLVVDQLEELFTLNPSETQAGFADLLGRVSTEAGVHILLSMRDDFLIRCSEHEALAPVFTADLTPLLALEGDGLRRALVEPANKGGFAFENNSLVEEMLASVEGARGALPLLAFAVSRLWERRDKERNLLTRAAYEEIGGVAGALAQHAEQTLERIGLERESIVRELFRNLVTAQWTRAAAERDELLSVLPDREVGGQVLDALIDARLLTSYEAREGTEKGAEATPAQHQIEIVHESLLRAWPRLVRWQAQDEEGTLLRDQLKQAAHLWEGKGRPDDLLWTGTSEREFELWRDRYPGALTSVEGDFATAMVHRARQQRRVRRTAVAAVFLALSALSITLSVSRHRESQARERAEVERQRAEASKLVALARLEMPADPTAALAYARKSIETSDSTEARLLAVEALWRGPVARVMPVSPPVACARLAASPDGRWLGCGSWHDALGLFADDGRTTHVLSGSRNAARPKVITFSDDGRRLASWAEGDDETVVWSTDGRRLDELRPGGVPRLFREEEVFLVDGDRGSARAWTPGSGSARVVARWELSSGALRDVSAPPVEILWSQGSSLFRRVVGDVGSGEDRLIGRHPSRLIDATYQDGTGHILSVDENHEVRVWSGQSHELLDRRQGFDSGRAFAPTLDRSGRRLAWYSSAASAVVIWDLAGPPDAAPLFLSRPVSGADQGHNGIFLGTGDWFAHALSDSVAFWPLTMPWPRVLRGQRSQVEDVDFTPDGQHLVSCGPGGGEVWPLTHDGGSRRSILSDQPWTCYGASADPSGGHVLVAIPTEAALLVSLEDGATRALVQVPPAVSIQATALDPRGRWAATAAVYSPDVEDRRLHVVDRHTGEVQAFALPGANAESGATGGVWALDFGGNGRLYSVGEAGLLAWDPTTGRHESLNSTPCRTLDASAHGWRLAATCTKQPWDGWETLADVPFPGTVLVVDLKTGEQQWIESHADHVLSAALDPSGRAVASVDTAGVVRVGLVGASEPHLLLGADGRVASIDISPDGRWLASAVGNDVWLWPIPDLAKPPLHALPREELLTKLDGLTNVRVANAPDEPTGYRVEVGPFPGWEDLPTW